MLHPIQIKRKKNHPSNDGLHPLQLFRNEHDSMGCPCERMINVIKLKWDFVLKVLSDFPCVTTLISNFLFTYRSILQSCGSSRFFFFGIHDNDSFKPSSLTWMLFYYLSNKKKLWDRKLITFTFFFLYSQDIHSNVAMFEIDAFDRHFIRFPPFDLFLGQGKDYTMLLK